MCRLGSQTEIVVGPDLCKSTKTFIGENMYMFTFQ